MTSLIIIEQTKKCEKNIIRKCKCNTIIERNELHTKIMTWTFLITFFRKSAIYYCTFVTLFLFNIFTMNASS